MTETSKQDNLVEVACPRCGEYLDVHCPQNGCQEIRELWVDGGPDVKAEVARLTEALSRIGSECECHISSVIANKALGGETLTDEDWHFPPPAPKPAEKKAER